MPRSEPRNFTNGLLAHMILVPSWVAAPFLLSTSCVAAGSPLGAIGVLTGLGIGGALCASSSMAQRAPMMIVLFGMGATADTPSRKAVALFGAGFASFLAWLCKGGKGPFAAQPQLRDWLCKWAPHYYDECELRGDLGSIRKDKTCFGFHPHGILCAGWTMNGTYNPEFWKAAGKINWLCDFNLRYKNPGFRWLCDATQSESSCVDGADKKTMLRYMDKGESFALLPGGFQDAVAHYHGKDVTVLKKRKGFIKYCLQYGYRVHPVYTFGECETFWAFKGLRKLRMKISEQNIPMVAFFGWPVLPFLPRPDSKLLTYVGPPIDLPHLKEPSKEDVDKWHQAYVKGLTDLFNSKKAEAGFPNATLDVT